MIAQKEVCPSTGREHWQVFVQYKNRVRASIVSKVFPSGKWRNAPMAKGATVQDNIDYCSKGDSKLEAHRTWGTLPVHKAKSSKLALAIQAMKDGASKHKIAHDFAEVYVHHGKKLDHWQQVYNTPIGTAKYTLAEFPDWEPITDFTNTIVLYGKSNIGKSQFARAHFKAPLVITQIDRLADLDYPRTHDGLIIDDCPIAKWSRERQMALTGVETDGHIRILYQSKTIPAGCPRVVVSNYDGWDVFGDNRSDGSVTRRSRLYHFIGSANKDCPLGIDVNIYSPPSFGGQISTNFGRVVGE